MISTNAHVLIIDPAPSSRNRLCASFRACGLVGAVHAGASITEFRRFLSLHQPLDVLVVSSRGDIEELQAVVSELREHPQGKSTVVVLETTALSDAAADLLMSELDSIDGELTEPYTPRVFSELLELVQERMRDSNFERIIELFIHEVRDQVDSLAELHRSGMTAKVTRSVLQDMCSALRHLDAAQQQRYFTKMIAMWSSLEAPCTGERFVEGEATISAAREITAELKRAAG